MVKITCGTARVSAVAHQRLHASSSTSGFPAARAAITSPQTRAWYLPMCVSSARCVTSPAAYSQPPSTPVTWRWSSTWSQLPGSTPTASKPRSSVRGCRPVATRISSHTRVSPPTASSTIPSGRRMTRSSSVPSSTATPMSRSDPVTASAAKAGTAPSNREPRWKIVTCDPSDAKTMAISHATTPPPTMARRGGTLDALVASRLVHGRASASPGTRGTAARLPVHTETAAVARSSIDAPLSLSTTTRRSPTRRPCPRTRSSPLLSIQETWDASSQSWTNRLRRPSTASTSNEPVTASAAPATARASASACAGRSSDLLGMQAQYEQSPPTNSASTTTTRHPPRAARWATFSPVDPPPITITSYVCSGMSPPVREGSRRAVPWCPVGFRWCRRPACRGADGSRAGWRRRGERTLADPVVARRHDDRTAGRELGHQVENHVVGLDVGRREPHPHPLARRGRHGDRAAVHLGAVEDQLHTGRRAGGQVCQQRDQSTTLLGGSQLGPAGHGHVVAIDYEDGVGSAQQVLGRGDRIVEQATGQRQRSAPLASDGGLGGRGSGGRRRRRRGHRPGCIVRQRGGQSGQSIRQRRRPLRSPPQLTRHHAEVGPGRRGLGALRLGLFRADAPGSGRGCRRIRGVGSRRLGLQRAQLGP